MSSIETNPIDAGLHAGFRDELPGSPAVIAYSVVAFSGLLVGLLIAWIA